MFAPSRFFQHAIIMILKRRSVGKGAAAQTALTEAKAAQIRGEMVPVAEVAAHQAQELPQSHSRRAEPGSRSHRENVVLTRSGPGA